jgi:hypothetical protein
MRRLGVVLLVAALGGCGGDGDGGGDDGGDDVPDGDLAEVLAAIPGMSVTEEEVDPPYRFFRLVYQQPVDHDDPDGPTFGQRMTLVHRDAEAPMVLHTGGYHLYEDPFLSELAVVLDGNQVHVEQRFFGPSRPDPADWSKLTIEQAAADHHRIVQALAPLYPGAWLSTGASKGGMTSIFHRRFYPDDVDATVPYVAPISFGAPDDRYEPFLAAVGDESCHTAVEDYQREMLARREVMQGRLEAWAAEREYTYERLGGIANAFEDSVVEFEWGYWQYLGDEWCQYLPAADAPDDDLWSFHADYAGALDYLDDEAIADYEPYYYQSETQLGYPSSPTAHIDDLLVTQDEPRDYLPADAPIEFDPASMEDIASWVASDAERMLFIYGEWDPWTGGAFDLGDAADSFEYVMPRGTHGSRILTLDEPDRAAAFAALERWTGVTPVVPEQGRRRRGLPPEPAPRAPR